MRKTPTEITRNGANLGLYELHFKWRLHKQVIIRHFLARLSTNFLLVFIVATSFALKQKSSGFFSFVH